MPFSSSSLSALAVLSVTGFLVLDHYDLLPEFIAEVGPWVASGELKYRETIVDGIENDASINLANAKQRPEVFAQLRAIPKTRLLVEFLEHYGAQLGEIPEDIQARAEDLVRNSTPADDGGSAQLFHVADAVDTKRAFPLLPLPSLPKEKEKRVAPASPAAAPAPLGAVAQRDRERGEEADRLARELCDLAGEKGAVAGVVCRFYLEEAERGLVDFYEKRGGLYTPTRRRDLLAGLVKVAGKTPSAMLFALEKYIDLKAGVADEHWLLGAARGLARDLAASVKEFDDGIEAHRRRHKGGAAAQAAEVVDA